MASSKRQGSEEAGFESEKTMGNAASVSAVFDINRGRHITRSASISPLLLYYLF